MGDRNTTADVAADVRSAAPALFPGMTAARKHKARQRIEALEERLHWSVTQDANGWTVVNNPGANIIYVSSSQGNDNNAGTINAPVKSFAKAQALSVSGPNEILLKAGDVFNDSFPNWTLSGQSASAPFLLSYYPQSTTPAVLPQIYTGTAGVGFSTAAYSNSGAILNYLDIIGLQFDANLRDPTLGTPDPNAVGGVKGFKFIANGGNVLLEDDTFNCYGNAGGDNLDIEGLGGTSNYLTPSVSNITIRRCVVTNAYALTSSTTIGKSEGLYAFNASNISVVQSTFDHNGWDAQVANATDNGYSHDMYFGPTCTGIDVEQSVIAEASYAGIMDRSGGNILNNLFVDNAVALSFGSADGVMSTVGGVSGSIVGNVVVGDKPQGSLTNSPLAFGQGFVIANTRPGANVLVSNNLFTGDTQNAKPAITVTMATTTSNPTQAVGINDLTISNNVINGWRQGIQTDGRFVPGGTGLYALNNLKISHNDFINATTQEVRHDGGFAPASESWSGDRYYDSILAQSSWVTLQSKNLPYATWMSNYDIGATTLLTLPYADPSRSAATYDVTLGGPGTFQDYLANARLLSINNYQPVYMAQAAVSYIDAGFNITSSGISGSGSGSGLSGGLPTAGAIASNVNTTALNATTYTFTVNYTDGFILNTRSLGSSNILVTGPNGFSAPATFVSNTTPTTDGGGYQHVTATYSIVAPGGKWVAGEDGTYTISLLPNQVTDQSGAAAPSGAIGLFTANFVSPVTATVVSNVVSGAGTTGSTFTVTYSDPVGIDTTTLNSFEVQVTGPNNFARYASLGQVTANSTGTVVTATYTIAAPGGNFTASTNGTYTISLAGGTVADFAGNTAAAGTLATFQVAASNTSTGTASISGTVFNDANGNGLLDARELPMVGVTVFIDVAGTGVYATGDPSAVTDSNGAYTFTGLQPGRYTVGQTIPTGFGQISPGSGFNVVTLTTSVPSATMNFGDQLGAVSINSGGTGSTGTTTGGTTKTSGTSGSTSGTSKTSSGSGTKTTGTSGGTTGTSKASSGSGTKTIGTSFNPTKDASQKNQKR